MLRRRKVAPAVQGEASTAKEGSFVFYLFRAFIYGTIFMVLGGTIALAAGSALGLYRAEVVLSGSMAPKYKAGDVVIALSKPKGDLRVGDVLIFRSPDQYGGDTIIHRVVGAEKTATEDVYITTKGDANGAADPWSARVTSTEVWEVEYGVPYVGYAANKAKQWWPLLIAIALAIPMLSYANEQVREVYRKEPEPEDEAIAPVGAEVEEPADA